MGKPIIILHLEDNPIDAELIQAKLESEKINCDIVRVKDRQDFEATIAESPFDLILSDYSVPHYNGFAALKFARQKYPDVPFILVSGTLGEEQAVESLKNGATDYIIKQRLTRLGPAIRRALEEAKEVTERKQAEAALQQSEERYRLLFEHAADTIFALTPTGAIKSLNHAFETLTGWPPVQWIGRSYQELIHPDDQTRAGELFQLLLRDGRAPTFELRVRTAAGGFRDVEFTGFSSQLSGGRIEVQGIGRDITERKRSEAELEKVHKELLEASRQAGMAEVATGVLHNVGNVLNSVTVASSCMAASLKKSKTAYLSKVVALLREHETDLGVFLTSDPKGRQVPAYLAQLAEQLAVEQAVALKELAQLQKNIEHIKEVVTVQQSRAKGAGKSETLQVTDLVEDTLRMDSGGQADRDIQVIREFDHTPAITVEKHKVLQILMNLVRNAKQACHEAGRLEKRLTLRVTNGDDRVRIAVSDNGAGISPENLARIFAHGFTTKKDGHGFGLHSGALAAKELGGALTVQSDGDGQGATFTLTLPLQPPKTTS